MLYLRKRDLMKMFIRQVEKLEQSGIADSEGHRASLARIQEEYVSMCKAH